MIGTAPDVEGALANVRTILRQVLLRPAANYAAGWNLRVALMLQGEDPVAGRNVMLGIFDRAYKGEPWARKMVTDVIRSRKVTGQTPLPLCAEYERAERDGKLVPLQRGPSSEAQFYRNLFIRGAVVAAMHHGLPRTHNRKHKHKQNALPSACSLVRSVLIDLYGFHGISEARIERLTDDIAQSPDWSA